MSEEIADLLRIGCEQIGEKDYLQAESTFQKVLALDINNEMARLGISIVLDEMGKHREAYDMISRIKGKQLDKEKLYSNINTIAGNLIRTDPNCDLGMTFSTAIKIHADNSMDGIRKEKEFIRHIHGRFNMLQQSLHEVNGTYYDILEVELDNTEIREYYFDISAFFGKF
ncbi:MAG: hypothetical protein INQ03_12840 [Candidatus Heimdallarchaeota archaeon]|nr:hypothetical protein [Candidatus Heimdallarchaeota archaeon]